MDEELNIIIEPIYYGIFWHDGYYDVENFDQESAHFSSTGERHSQNAHHRNAGHSTLSSPAFQFAYQRNFSVSLCPLTVSKVFNCIVRSKVIHEIIVGIDLSIRRNIDKFYFAIGIDFSLLNLETGFA